MLNDECHETPAALKSEVNQTQGVSTASLRSSLRYHCTSKRPVTETPIAQPSLPCSSVDGSPNDRR